MTITYPLSLPPRPAIAKSRFTARSVVAVSESPFTLSTQVQQHQGERWEAELSLPPMKRLAAEPWLVFRMKLKGRLGTFLMGDPDGRRPQVNTAICSPLVSGAGQTGEEIVTDGWQTSDRGITCDSTLVTSDATAATCDSANVALRAGDYVQFGSGLSARLHKLLDHAEITDSTTGKVTLTVWPSVRVAHADNSAITYRDAKGLFRMSSNEMSWDASELPLYGVTFAAQSVVP
jgi:hypothetical protein